MSEFLNQRGVVSSTWSSEAVLVGAGHSKRSADADAHAPARAPAQLLSCSHGEDRIARSQRTHSATMIRSRARANMPSPRPVAQRVCHRWQRLVCPERRLYVVTNEAELQSAVPESPAGKARYDLLKNLRQMLEWTSVGNSSGDINDRSGRKNAGDWQPLGKGPRSVVWLKHDDAPEIVPLVGSLGHKYKTVVPALSLDVVQQTQDAELAQHEHQSRRWVEAKHQRSRGLPLLQSPLLRFVWTLHEGALEAPLHSDTLSDNTYHTFHCFTVCCTESFHIRT